MKKVFLGGIVVLMLSAFLASEQKEFPVLNNSSFTKGEQLDYRVNFGIFTVGHAVTRVDSRYYTINSRPCYKVDGFGKTSGFIAWLSKVDDQWGAYVDTASIVTHISYRKIKEGRYRKDELITFDHKKKKAEVKVLDQETGVYQDPQYYDTPENVRDIVAGFLYLRVFNFSKIHVGDTIPVSGFFEDTAYRMLIIYKGKEVVNTKVGKIRCHVLVPVMPDNKLFDGENSVTAWISDDKNQIPVNIQAKMFIGSTGLELSDYKGLRHKLQIVK
jgi:hypothetical protein